MGVPGRLIRPVLGRRRLQRLFELCLETSMRGMNLDAPSDMAVNGERALVEMLARRSGRRAGPWALFDVGANTGDWSAMASEVLVGAGIDHEVWAFEPGHETYSRLVAHTASLPAVRPQQVALGSEEGEAMLRYDEPASGLASLYPRRSVALKREERIAITTLDRFRHEHGIRYIDLLKIDVEGHELAVLRGAAETLSEGAVDAVQFEFGGTHVDSRTFMRDLFDALGPRFEVYRILRDGLRPLGQWSERLEIFRLGNYVALLQAAAPEDPSERIPGSP